MHRYYRVRVYVCVNAYICVRVCVCMRARSSSDNSKYVYYHMTVDISLFNSSQHQVLIFTKADI